MRKGDQSIDTLIQFFVTREVPFVLFYGYQIAEEKLNALLAERKRMETEALAISGMLFELMELEQLPIEFDEKLWNATVERLTVYEDERLVFSLKDGTEITVLI